MPIRFALARWLLLMSVVLAACSTPPDLVASQYPLDEHRSVPINVVSAGLVYGRINPNTKSGTRDYVTLVAAEEDNAGKYTQLFLMYRWSRSFSGQAPQPEQNAGSLIVVADGREIEMEPLDRIPIDLAHSKDLFSCPQFTICPFTSRSYSRPISRRCAPLPVVTN